MSLAHQWFTRDAAKVVLIGIPVRHSNVPKVVHLAAYLVWAEHIVYCSEAPEEELTLVCVAALELDFIYVLHDFIICHSLYMNSNLHCPQLHDLPSVDALTHTHP